VGFEPTPQESITATCTIPDLVTALAPKIGYDNAAKVAKTVPKEHSSLREAPAVKLGFPNRDEFDALGQPEDMTHP